VTRLHRIMMTIGTTTAALAAGAGIAQAACLAPSSADRADFAEGIRYCAKVEVGYAYESCVIGHVVETRGRAVPENAWTELDDDNGTGVPEMRLVKATKPLTPVSKRRPSFEDRAIMLQANDDCRTIDDLTVAWRNCVVGAFTLESYADSPARYVTDDSLNAKWSTRTHRFTMTLDYASQREAPMMHTA
jgi:hypothetical protein